MNDYQEFLKKKQLTIVNSGFEINESYFEQATKNIKQIESETSQPKLF